MWKDIGLCFLYALLGGLVALPIALLIVGWFALREKGDPFI